VTPPPDAEVVIVGAGVMGLATARVLAQAGRDVVLCEQFEVGHARGSSHGGSRIVRLSYPEARWVRWAQESYPLWRELEAEYGRALFDQPGTLDLGDWQPNRDALAACGAPYEVLDAAEIGRRFPIRVEAGVSGLFQADGGIVFADLALQAFRESAEAAGADVREGVRVDSVAEAGGVVAADGVRARVAVVTAGAWAPRLAGVDAIPTRETTSYFSFDEPVPSVIDATLEGTHGYALAAPGIGLKAGRHQTGPAVDPDEPAERDEEIVAQTAAWVERRFPDAGPLLQAETCLYTTRAGDEFVLERRGRVVVGSPCSGHGFKFAPLIGKKLAALAEEALAD
jgi:sarcosine oxidase